MNDREAKRPRVGRMTGAQRGRMQQPEVIVRRRPRGDVGAVVTDLDGDVFGVPEFERKIRA